MKYYKPHIQKGQRTASRINTNGKNIYISKEKCKHIRVKLWKAKYKGKSWRIAYTYTHTHTHTHTQGRKIRSTEGFSLITSARWSTSLNYWQDYNKTINSEFYAQ